MTFHLLDRDWTVSALRGPVPEELRGRLEAGIPATVPGVVHTDLLDAGLIPDPYDADNESVLAWIGRTDWRYRTEFVGAEFDVPAGPAGGVRIDLVADGLDTVTTVELNGVEIARTANQHRAWRWDVAPALREGRNELTVTFRSAIDYAEEREAVLGERPHAYHHPYNAIRKSACNFGWDWGPDVVTAGIWRRIGLERWRGVRLAGVRPIAGVDADGTTGTLEVHVELEWAPGAAATTLTAAVAGAEASARLEPGQTRATLALRVPDADLWWPIGYGDPARHDLTVTAGEAAWSGRVGFRSVEVDTAPDEHGSPFAVRVNGRDVFVRGANWIPDDTFVTRITRDRLAASIGDATEAGLNLLRVWGGGIYESEDFYDLCDERGVLVWQDFLLACAAYSEDAELWDEFEAEAREAITRLTAHPSLAIWNGGNENIWGYVDWDWRRRLGDRTWGEGYYQDLFPRLVAELAPGTPYSPGSPYGFSRYVHPNDPAHGTVHIWDVWNQVDYDVYRDYRPRFVSEFGFQGPAAWSTLFSVVHDEPPTPFGPQMLVHQKAVDGNGKLERGLGSHLPQPATIEDWHWATQLNQARAVAFGIEHFRSLFPLNRGSIVWQLNDCWPVVSWAAVDSHGIRKPLWHALRRVSADRLLTVQPRDGGLVAIAHNDHDAPWSGELVVRRVRFDGTELAAVRLALDVAPRDAAAVPLPVEVAQADDASRELLVAEVSGEADASGRRRSDVPLGGERALWYFDEDPRLALAPARERSRALEASAERIQGGYRVTVTASALAKDVTLLADRVDASARVDRALVTLLAGESAVFEIACDADIDPAAFTDPLVLRSANDLVARARTVT